MVALITIATFVVVLCIVLLVGNAMAQRNASANLYRERLQAINQAAARGSSRRASASQGIRSSTSATTCSATSTSPSRCCGGGRR